MKLKDLMYIIPPMETVTIIEASEESSEWTHETHYWLEWYGMGREVKTITANKDKLVIWVEKENKSEECEVIL